MNDPREQRIQQSAEALEIGLARFARDFQGSDIRQQAALCVDLACATLRHAGLLYGDAGRKARRRCLLGAAGMLSEQSAADLLGSHRRWAKGAAQVYAELADRYEALLKISPRQPAPQDGVLPGASPALFANAAVEAARQLLEGTISGLERRPLALLCEATGINLLESATELYSRARLRQKAIACIASLVVIDFYRDPDFNLMGRVPHAYLRSFTDYLRSQSELYSLAPSFGFLFADSEAAAS